MKRIASLFLLLSYASLAQPASPEEDGWAILAKVKFTERFFKEYNQSYLCPLFDTRIRAYEGKEFTLKGHYLPLDVNDKRMIILSKYPFSMCFFCGGAGPESVAEVYFTVKPPKFKADQIITVKGKLKLNDSDVNHMNFILQEAVLVNE